MSRKDLVKELQELGLGTRLKRLSDTLMGDVSKVYKEQQLDFEPRWFTMLYLLNEQKTLSIIDIADSLKLTHPAVVQFADQMQEQKLVIAKKDRKDARKRLIALSAKGKIVFEELQPILVQIEKSTRELMESTGFDVLSVIDKMEKQLETKSMYERVRNGLRDSLLEEVYIVPYQPAYKEDFRTLNEEWLNEYFVVEKADAKVLGNPEKYILQNGGAVFFAVNKKNVVGTVAIIRHESKVYELSKMAVAKAFQGNTIGSLLVRKAIDFSKKKKATQLFLETNLNIGAAVHLYEKFGFKQETRIQDSKYNKTSLKMSLDLH